MENEIKTVLSEMWQEACKNGRTVSFKIASGSMRPTIEVGDVVGVRRVKLSEIRAGDIVAFKEEKNVIVHRIVRVNRTNGFLTFLQMGDVGGISQIIRADRIIGKVASINKNGREIRLDSLKQSIINRLSAWRLLIIDSTNRGRHRFINTGLRLFFRPAWRVCRNLLLGRS
jgi:signal peptidase I